MSAMDQDQALTAILDPRSVAIVGASDDTAKWGGSILALLRKFHYAGAVYAVNPRSASVQGVASFASVEAIGQPVDVAVLAVPHERAVAAMQDCVRAGVKGVLMVTSQFAEAGEEGRALQDELVAIARAGGVRIIGPNCMGYFNSHADLCLLNSQALMRSDVLTRGRIALISQSGALAGAMLARACDLGVGLSFCVSLGNQADLEVCDFFEYAIADPHSQVIALYVEGLKDPSRFRSLLLQARAAGKPVLLVKAGRTDAGTRAVQSHTASMAGSYQSFAAVVRSAGAVVVDDYLDLVVHAAAWSTLPAPSSAKVAVMSGSGGGGAVACDQVAEGQLQVASLGSATVQALEPLMPQSCAHVPFDLGAVPGSYRSARANWLQDVLVTMMADPEVGAGIYVMTTQPDMAGAAAAVQAVNRLSGKPLLFVNAASSSGAEAEAVMRAHAQVSFASVEQAVRFLSDRLAAQREHALAAPPQAPQPVASGQLEAITRTFDDGLIAEHQAKQLFAAVGIPVTRGEVADSADAAVRVAAAIGYPVVMKVVSAQISHKSDIGGVVVGVADEAGVRRHFAALQAAVAKVPGAGFDGCLVQQMARADAELLVGTHWDEQFGPMLMFGFGGTLVELQRDTALLPATANQAQIGEALSRLRLYPLLTGFRGRPAADLVKLVDLIWRMGQMAVQLGARLAECEANPVMVQGASVLVADARAVWRKS